MQTFAQSIESDLSSLQRDGRHLSVALRLASNGDEDLREVCQAAAAGLVNGGRIP